jgi:hypothetical protein
MADITRFVSEALTSTPIWHDVNAIKGHTPVLQKQALEAEQDVMFRAILWCHYTQSTPD